MARFCACFAPNSPEADLNHEIGLMGGEIVHQTPNCVLGIVPSERPGRSAGPYYGPQGMVAVGEVTLFNRADLITMLKDKAASLNPQASDGEVLLWVYAQMGPSGLAQVEGMFALAIWDGQALILARDPVGMRTLFYTNAAGVWGAASSLRSLRRWPRLPIRLNLAAVRSFLTFAYLPGAQTFFENVYELLPGAILCLTPDTLPSFPEPQSYWEPYEGDWSDEMPLNEYAAQLRGSLETGIKRHLPLEMPVGVFLSGGLDSSLVAALATKHHAYPIHTYSINFGPDLPNELAFSDMVAQYCQTQHRVLTFSGQEIAAGLAETIALFDCPVGDPLTVPNLLLARAAAADGLSVILNGEGGDPCFGGPKNIPMLVYEWHRTDPDPLDRARAYLRSYRKCYAYLPRLLSPAVQDTLKDAPPLEALVLPYLQTDRMSHYLNKLIYANVRLKGAHHILTKVERLTAASGLEGRSPLFASSLVEQSFAIPPRFKLAGVEEKWVLKKAVQDLLPKTIVYRPKSGMRVPVQHWLQGPLRRLTYEVLLGTQTRQRGLFQADLIRAWLRGEGSLWPRQGMMLWIVLTLELWLQAYLDKSN